MAEPGLCQHWASRQWFPSRILVLGGLLPSRELTRSVEVFDGKWRLRCMLKFGEWDHIVNCIVLLLSIHCTYKSNELRCFNYHSFSIFLDRFWLLYVYIFSEVFASTGVSYPIKRHRHNRASKRNTNNWWSSSQWAILPNKGTPTNNSATDPKRPIASYVMAQKGPKKWFSEGSIMGIDQLMGGRMDECILHAL